MDDAAQNAPVIHTRHAPHIGWKQWLDPGPLRIGKPEEIRHFTASSSRHRITIGRIWESGYWVRTLAYSRVDERGQSTKMYSRLANDREHPLAVGHVASRVAEAISHIKFLDKRRAAIVVDIGHHDVGALGHEIPDNTLAAVVRRSGDEDPPTGVAHHSGSISIPVTRNPAPSTL